MKFDEILFEAFDEERKRWCVVTDMDVDRNKIGMSNGCVRFWRDLDKVELRIIPVKEHQSKMDKKLLNIPEVMSLEEIPLFFKNIDEKV